MQFHRTPPEEGPCWLEDGFEERVERIFTMRAPNLIRFRISLVLIATLVLVGHGRGDEMKSLLVNGDFEAGPGNDLPGWSRSFYPGREGDVGTCLRRSEERARSGRGSFQIDTGSILGEEVTLVFNGQVSEEALRLQGRRLVLSGWVYIAPGTAVRPIGMRLRTFGPDAEGKNAFLGDVLEVTVLGQPGEWVPFRATGTVPMANLTSLDLHCGLRPDTGRTVQFLDDLRLEPLVPPPLEICLLRDAVWRDEKALPVEVRINDERMRSASLTFRLVTRAGKVVRQWNLPPHPQSPRIAGLPWEGRRLSEGGYVLHAELHRGQEVMASAEASLQVSESPWENAPQAGQAPPRKPNRRTDAGPAGFLVAGTVAPTEAPDELPTVSELPYPGGEPPEWTRRGYAVFSRHYLDLVSRLGRPRPGEDGPVRLFASPGEYEPATVAVWAIRSQQGVRVTVSDLRGPGSTIPARHMDVRVVRRIRGLPPFLEKREEVDIPEGQTQTFWMTFYFPPATPPGFYRGEIEVAPQDAAPTRTALLVRVLPLKLPPPVRGYGFWWKMDARWNGYNSKERDAALEQVRQQFVLLREHGCNMVSCYGMPKMAREADGSVSFDFTQDHWGHDAFSLTDFFRLGRETGFFSPQVPLQYPGAESLHSDWIARAVGLDPNSAAFDNFYRNACRRVDAWAKEQGFTLAFACIDEIGNSEERRREALRFYRVAQEAGVLTSVTDNSMHAGMHLMGQPRFDEIIALRLYNFITPEMIEHTRQAGDGLWLYNLGSGGWEARRDRFVFGLFTERCGAAGHAQWAFQWPPGNVNPYEAAAAGQSSGYHYALPAPDGPLPTLALEGVREGIDDARYLSLLAPESRETFLAEIEPFSTTMSAYLAAHSGSFLEVQRWQIAREVLRRAR